MKEKSKMMTFNDFCYTVFGSFGRALFRLYPGVEDSLDAGNMKISAQVYLSIISFLTIVASSVVAAAFLLFWLSIWSNFILGLSTAFFPLVILIIGLAIPAMKASNRMSGLRNEIPYASMHMSVMSSGGLNPYVSLLRLKNTDLLPKLKEEVGRIQSLILSSGCDPISAMEKAARVMHLREYKDLLLGYASTLRTGGDVLHYLYSQTQGMFRNMAGRIKAMGESLGALMEAYSIIEIMGGLGLYMMFVIGFALPQAGLTLSAETFFLFSFIALPMVSIAFLYISDTLQINYPVSHWRTYSIFFCTLPITLFLATQMALSFLIPELLIIPPLQNLTLYLVKLFDFGEGCEPAIGLAFSFIVSTIPALIADRHYSKEEMGVLNGVTTFLRDLVENRKTGLSPEKCIQVLSDKDYRGFSKHLRRASSEISWGKPLREIFEGFRMNVRSWLAQINMFLLIDSIEVGGGTVESLESLAEFSESIRDIESERKATLAPLFLVPYIGAALLTMTTVLLLQFFNDMLALSSTSLPLVELGRTLLSPLILHSYMLGIVTGKITTGRASAGFKHAIVLILVSLAGIWMASHFKFFSMG